MMAYLLYQPSGSCSDSGMCHDKDIPDFILVYCICYSPDDVCLKFSVTSVAVHAHGSLADRLWLCPLNQAQVGKLQVPTNTIHNHLAITFEPFSAFQLIKLTLNNSYMSYDSAHVSAVPT